MYHVYFQVSDRIKSAKKRKTISIYALEISFPPLKIEDKRANKKQVSYLASPELLR